MSALVEDLGDLAIGAVIQQPVDLGDDLLAGRTHLAPEWIRRPRELSGRAAAQTHPQIRVALIGVTSSIGSLAIRLRSRCGVAGSFHRRVKSPANPRVRLRC